MKTPLLCTALALFCLGCSGEPSDKDLRAALERDAAKHSQALNQTAGIFGGHGQTLLGMIGTVEIHAVRKIGCVEAGQVPGFVCDVEVDMTVPVVGRTKDMTQARFVKGPDGWVMVR